MRTIELGGRKINIMGSPMTPFYYKQAFKQSFSGDLISLNKMKEDPAEFDDINLLQMIWAMEKTINKNIKPFAEWLEEFEFLNLSDIMADATEEAMNATFRDKPETKGE